MAALAGSGSGPVLFHGGGIARSNGGVSMPRTVIVFASAESDEVRNEVPARRRAGRKASSAGNGAPKRKISSRKKQEVGGDNVEVGGELESPTLDSGVSVAAFTTAARSSDEKFSSTRSLYAGAGKMTAEEKDLRLFFLESLLQNARSGNIGGVEEVITEMNVVGLKPGPRSYHGVVAAYARANDVEGALNALRMEAVSGEAPLQETFLAVGRLLGRAGLRVQGEKNLAAMECFDLDPRYVWNVTVEELFKAGHLNEANTLFMSGANAGLRASDHLYDILVEENCKTNKHGVAVHILRSMEARGRLATTFHYNCLLLAQGNAGYPDIASDTFDEMQYDKPHAKPDVESYNLMIQGQTRCNNGERVKEVVDYLGMMIEDHPRVKPNARTYALLIECFVKFNVINEAARHFRALTRLFPGSLHLLHCNGEHGDPLSLLLRSFCLDGRIVELVEVLDLMIKEGLRIAPRAMFMNRKGRTLVSSWVEPIQQEADIGCEVDFMARYIAEGGLTGERRRWIPGSRKDPQKLPDYEGFRFFPPRERSYKQFCALARRVHRKKIITLLEYEGAYALGENATKEEYDAILERLRKEQYRKKFNEERKPKAASKLSVAEMKEELEAQGLPTDGTRAILYQRVQKARRMNLAKGQPLWMPPEEDKDEEIDEDFEATLAKIDLRNPRQQYRKKCFIEGVGLENCYKDNPRMSDEPVASAEESVAADDTDGDYEDDVVVIEKDEEELLDPMEHEIAEPATKSKAADDDDEDVEEEIVAVEEERPFKEEGSYVKSTLEEKRAELIESRFDFSELDEIEEVWGWTWERELQVQKPEHWFRKHEVELGIQVLQKVLELGGTPTIGDCAMHVRNAMKIPWPKAVVTLLQESHKLGHKFGGKLYEDAVTCCLSVDEIDAAIAILTDMEEAGISPSTDLIGRVVPPES